MSSTAIAPNTTPSTTNRSNSRHNTPRDSASSLNRLSSSQGQLPLLSGDRDGSSGGELVASAESGFIASRVQTGQRGRLLCCLKVEIKTGIFRMLPVHEVGFWLSDFSYYNLEFI